MSYGYVHGADRLIDDGPLDSDLVFPVSFGRGYAERDYREHPVEMFAGPSQIPLIPRNEWDARIEEQEREQSSLEHLRDRELGGQPFPSYDQNGEGYCWSYSVGGAVTLSRFANHQPTVRLSCHAVACVIKQFRDEGGWCGLSAQFARGQDPKHPDKAGYPTVEHWPEKSMSRAHNTAATWANAKQHAITEDFVDLTRPVWGQNLTFDQVATCLLLNLPCALDYNWWRHSVAGMRLVRVEADSYGIKIWNSWTDRWGNRGTSVLRGNRAVPDGAICVRVTRASVN